MAATNSHQHALRLPTVGGAMLHWGLTVVTTAALAVDAYVHADLATSYDSVTNGSITQGELFRIEAGAAALAALLLLLLGRTTTAWLFAFLVAAAGIAAVLVYRYIDVGTLGPIPNMHEPLWYPEKTTSAVAEGIATVTAFAGLVLTRSAKHRR